MPDRKTPPPFVRSTTFSLLKPVRETLSNGIALFFIAGGSQEIIKVELVMEAGRWYEFNGGASYFASNLIEKGTKNKTSYEIAQRFDLFGAHLEISPGLDVVSIALYALTSKLAPCLELLLELLTDAAYPEKELQQMKAIYLQNLKVNNEKTSYVASKLFRRHLLGENHPYGREIDEPGVQAIHRDSLLAHAELFRHLSIFVSGKIDDANQKLICSTFASLSPAPARPQPTFISDGAAFSVYQEKEGSVQSSLRIGKKSLLRADADYFDVLFVSHILGGYFGSRLMKNIREEKGLTYGIHCSIHALRHESYMVIGADVDKENITLTADEIRKEIDRLKDEPVTADELETARNHFTGSLQSEINTPFAHADKIKNIEVFGLSPDYYQDMITRIEEITTDDIMRISSLHLRASDCSQVAAG